MSEKEIIEDMRSRSRHAREAIEEIKAQITQYEDALTTLRLNQAAWSGFIEALSSYCSKEEEDT